MSLKNISPSVFRDFLKDKGLNYIGTKGGHEKWSKKDMLRPVIFQTHIDPIPEFIIRNNLRSMNCTAKDLEAWLHPKK